MLNRLMDSIPPYYKKSFYTKSILGALGAELAALSKKAEKAGQERYVMTSEDTLRRWEEEFGIALNTLGIDLKRKQIIAKMRGTGTTTVEKIRSVAAAVFGDSNVRVTEHNREYYFVVHIKITQNNITEGISSICQTIDEIKPAHLDYKIGLYYDTKADVVAAAIAIVHHTVRISPLNQ